MESLGRQMYAGGPRALLPGTEGSETRLLPAQKGGLHADVVERNGDVVVTADLIPGVEKKNITLDLINPHALEISCERKDEKTEEKEGYYLRERSFGSVTRVIPLPKPVTAKGASATFKNGVLEVHLKRATAESQGKISIA